MVSVSRKLAGSTSSGRASAVGMLQAILQVMLQGPRPWALYLLLDGRFIPGFSFLASLIPGHCLLLALLAPRHYVS